MKLEARLNDITSLPDDRSPLTASSAQGTKSFFIGLKEHSDLLRFTSICPGTPDPRLLKPSTQSEDRGAPFTVIAFTLYPPKALSLSKGYPLLKTQNPKPKTQHPTPNTQHQNLLYPSPVTPNRCPPNPNPNKEVPPDRSPIPQGHRPKARAHAGEGGAEHGWRCPLPSSA